MAATKTSKRKAEARDRRTRSTGNTRAKKGSTPPHLGFVCPVPDCQKVFSRQTDMAVRHARLHSDDPKPFKCELDNCGRGFSQQSGLKQHQRSGIHGNVKAYRCRWAKGKCSQAFNDPSSRTRHEHFVHGPGKDMRYYCHCGLSYKRPSGLKKHHDAKHPKIPYEQPDPEPIRSKGSARSRSRQLVDVMDVDETSGIPASDPQERDPSQDIDQLSVSTENQSITTQSPSLSAPAPASRASSLPASPLLATPPPPPPATHSHPHSPSNDHDHDFHLDSVYSHCPSPREQVSNLRSTSFPSSVKGIETLARGFPSGLLPRALGQGAAEEADADAENPLVGLDTAKNRWSLDWILNAKERLE
ncbi:hypothetical protein SISNIDRAFT_468171 [Sistotremastrum niveocremeum HHB9708]|uniref:C2H2-type domain-containing protein n=1 Tax=Sistotremastrum niveocremeum HHB9708 TaxID=1314777 RepID=A0A164RVU9_9AGAM|nr:hypothetical protein SISNIDRAFT_468171 [Sistotremastrum niveocremeum HHB9708]